jgi:hypothetical protein
MHTIVVTPPSIHGRVHAGETAQGTPTVPQQQLTCVTAMTSFLTPQGSLATVCTPYKDKTETLHTILQ